jgi:thiol-disulfide isomerase/thioredoxin
MRLTSLLLALAVAVSVSADEPTQLPRKNPFRDGTGKGTVEDDAPAKPRTATVDPVKNAPRILRPVEVGVGRLVPDVEFTDLTGKSGKLSDFKASKLTVVALTNTTCPLCKKYAPVLARLEKAYAEKGVAFLFVNPTAVEKPADHGFTGRYVHDTEGKLVAALGATSTTEVFVLDAARTIVYRGAVDDQYGLGYAVDAPRNLYLVTALNEALAGKLPTIAETTAPGCALEYDAAKALPIARTYHARIERIVQANCVECHRAGGSAPFSLETYDAVVAHKAMIRKVVDRGTMPPWFASQPQAGHSAFSNDRSLTETDKKDLLAWLGGDLKKGDPSDAPLPRKFESGWLIGQPDAVFELPRAVAIKAEGTMPYQNLRVETNFDEDRWVQALEVQPTAREVTHHVLVFAVPKGGRLGGGEAAGFFAVYVPGNNVLIYPEGYAKKLPKGATLHFQMHYTPNGKATTDRTRIGLVFAKQPPKHEVQVAGIVNTRFEIPAGEGNHRVDARIPVPFDAKILALFPHAHLRGKAAKFELSTPDGKTTTLLDVPHYDFNWQLQYRFAESVSAPRGSRLTYTAWYDNSDKNPANPDSKKPVRWGQQTYEEMHLGYVEFVIEGR